MRQKGLAIPEIGLDEEGARNDDLATVQTGSTIGASDSIEQKTSDVGGIDALPLKPLLFIYKK